MWKNLNNWVGLSKILRASKIFFPLFVKELLPPWQNNAENNPFILMVKAKLPKRNLRSGYLDPGEGLDDPDEVLLQQVVVQFGQMGADDGVIPQLRLVVCEGLEVWGTLVSLAAGEKKEDASRNRTRMFQHQPFRSRPATGSCWPAPRISASPSAKRNPTWAERISR